MRHDAFADKPEEKRKEDTRKKRCQYKGILHLRTDEQRSLANRTGNNEQGKRRRKNKTYG